jgi:hypothetical protein
MKPARFLLDHPHRIPPAWCWREKWSTGLDSAYGLLMKFAKLNALSAREVAHVVIGRKSGKRTAILAKPAVDLRDFAVFDLDVMAELFHTTPSQLQSAFLFASLPESKHKSSENLRWCAKCAALGFHTPIFQMLVLRYCPIHAIPLQSACDFCRQPIPYRLQTDVTKRPFCCPTCDYDLAPGIRLDHEKVLKLGVAERIGLMEAMEFLKFEEIALPVKLEINKKRLQLGQGELILSKSDELGYFSRYIGFICHVIRDLGYEESTPQSPLPMERVERIQYGDLESTESEASEWFEAHHHASRSILRSHPGANWDDELRTIETVYRSIRRHIWRHVVVKHQDCIKSASEHLWWQMEGEVTTAFCPIAQAFIRWRMLWEGCTTPKYLNAQSRREPYGLIGWLSARPSPCPPHWSYGTRLWVTKHIFANACMESFREQLKVAQKSAQQGEIFWSTLRTAVHYDTYWAVTGRDSKTSPAVVYVRCPMEEETSPHLQERGKAHLKLHLAQLATIRR